MDDKDIGETMNGMAFLLHGLPPFLARAGPKDLGGRDGKDMVGALSIGPRKQVCVHRVQISLQAQLR